MDQILGNIGLLFEYPIVNVSIIIEGLMIGALFALAAYGLALVWGVMNVKNLAQGFKPSVLAKYVANVTPNVDVNASFLFKKVFWLGASYRSGNGFVLLTEYNITDFLRLGYSYDIVTNALKSQNRGTHEIFIGFDFAIGSGKNKAIDTRYL